MIAQMPAVLLQQDKLSKFSNSKTSVQYFTANKNKNKNKTAVNEKRVNNKNTNESYYKYWNTTKK